VKSTVDVKLVALQRAIQMLKSIGAQYKIILDDGTEYGALETAKSPKRKLAHPLGEIRQYYSSFMKDMKEGDVIFIPVREYGFKRIQGGVGTYASRVWGANSVVTTRDFSRDAVQVMRIC
jgi:hypothetical protein